MYGLADWVCLVFMFSIYAPKTLIHMSHRLMNRILIKSFWISIDCTWISDQWIDWTCGVFGTFLLIHLWSIWVKGSETFVTLFYSSHLLSSFMAVIIGHLLYCIGSKKPCWISGIATTTVDRPTISWLSSKGFSQLLIASIACFDLSWSLVSGAPHGAHLT